MKFITDGVHVLIDHLVMSETRQYTAQFYPPHLQGVQAQLAPISDNYTKTIETNQRKIYLSRKKAV